MCNLYSITTNQAVIIALFRVVNRYVGNLPPVPGVLRMKKSTRVLLTAISAPPFVVAGTARLG
jgi:hypothetical protein